MATAFNLEVRRGFRLREAVNLHHVTVTLIVFASLISLQAIGFLVLGTGRWGSGLSELLIVIQNSLAIYYSWWAFRRAEQIEAIFWFLFTIVMVILLIPTGLQAYNSLFNQAVVTESTRSLLYCLYGAPVLMMLFLPETDRRGRVRSEIFLDLFQVGIVVSLIYSTFFFFPARRMLPADAFLRNINISDVQSLILLILAFVRLRFARSARSRDLLLRLAQFLLICAVATFIGDWIYIHCSGPAIAWVDLIWAAPQVAASLLVLTWVPSHEVPSAPQPPKFAGFLATNLVLVTMLCGLNLLMDYWKEAHGETLVNAAIAVSLIAFSLRLALTQFHQQLEIAQRKAAQQQLTVSHQKIGRLLDSARRQTAEVTQISELGSLLQACTSKEEIFRLIPERLRRLFPGASGAISLFSTSGKRAESVAEWGVLCPPHKTFSPDQCWALRRGCTHTHAGGDAEPRCSHLLGDGPAVCIPLSIGGDTIGTLTIQNDDTPIVLAVADADAEAETLERRRELAATVSESVSLAIANVSLRESLRLQAVRDPLTGLYNRRYMQEFLDRELYTARRKHRPVAVMMIDLDHFKRYNDTFGHAAGDRAIAAVGETLLRFVRAEDVSCRYGGDEFVVILPECSLRQATIRVDEIRRRLQEQRVELDDQTAAPITISIGVAAFDETTDRVDLLLKCADDALYEAKRAGGDRVVLARPTAALPDSDFTEAPATPILSTKTQ